MRNKNNMRSLKKCLAVTVFTTYAFQLASGAFLRCYKGSLNNYLVTALDRPLDIWPCIDPNLPTVVYTFGYRGKTTGPATTAVLTAYVNKRKRNVLLLDWEEEAQTGLLGVPIGYAMSAVPNAKKIGKEMGDALMQLSRAGLNMTHMQLVGHSLGAHVMAYAGKRSRENGLVVSRITGLDPARALFDGAFAFYSGLDRTCARFVDIIHTDPGGYGSCASTGTVDIWPNYLGHGSSQPGCPSGEFEMFSKNDLCKHDRSWRYFAEAITSPTAILAASAASYDAWVANGGHTDQTIYLGDLTSWRATGNFYFTTNAQPPFARGSEGLRPPTNQARRRRYSVLTRFLKYLS